MYQLNLLLAKEFVLKTTTTVDTATSALMVYILTASVLNFVAD